MKKSTVQNTSEIYLPINPEFVTISWAKYKHLLETLQVVNEEEVKNKLRAKGYMDGFSAAKTLIQNRGRKLEHIAEYLSPKQGHEISKVYRGIITGEIPCLLD